MQFKPYEALQRRDVAFVHALLGMHLRVGMVDEQLRSQPPQGEPGGVSGGSTGWASAAVW